jgi:hypothetical protein
MLSLALLLIPSVTIHGLVTAKFLLKGQRFASAEEVTA